MGRKLINRTHSWLTLSLVFILLCLMTGSTQAQEARGPWPPFFFNITPRYENGQLEYRMRFSSRVDWAMQDITWRIPMPPGTQLAEADVQSTTTVGQDGNDVVFFTSVFHKPIRHAIFTLDIVDSEQTVFTTDVTVEWKGTYPGTYTIKNILIDTERQNLDWGKPRYPLFVGFTADVREDDRITYTLYPDNFSAFLRMWDLRINVPIPEGATFISAEAPPQYSQTFDGREVYFKIAELPKDEDYGPLRIHVSTADVPDDQLLRTYAWINWKNAGRGVGWWREVEGQYSTGELVVSPRRPQVAIADILDDVPLTDYDVTSLTMQDQSSSFQLIYRTVGPIATDDPGVFMTFIDADCRTDTGQFRANRGAEYRIRYSKLRNRADFTAWDSEQERWLNSDSTPLPFELNDNVLTMSVPYSLFNPDGPFCWVSINRSDSKRFNARFLPADRVPHQSDARLTEYRPTVSSQLALQLDKILADKDILIISAQLQDSATQNSETESAKVTHNGPSSQSQSQSQTTPPPQSQSQPTAERPSQPAPQPPQQPESAAPSVPIDDLFITAGDEWRYQPGWDDPPPSWTALSFDDGEWYIGKTSIGYGDGTFVTDLSQTVNNLERNLVSIAEQQPDSAPQIELNGSAQADFTSIFMRRTFSMGQPDTLSKLSLSIDYEDGFVAYLNGVEVARRGLRAAGTPVFFDTPATDQDAITSATIDLSEAIPQLETGENVLAIQVHRSLERSTLFINPALTWERDDRPAVTADVTTETEAANADAAQPDTANQAELAEAADAEDTSPEPAEVNPSSAVNVADNDESATVSAEPVAPTQPDVTETTTESTTPAVVEQEPELAEASPTGAESNQPEPERVDVGQTASSETQAIINDVKIVSNSQLASQIVASILAETATEDAAPASDAPLELGDTTPPIPAPQINFASPNPNPAIIDTSGKIAVPVDNGQGLYDVYVYTVRFGYGWETAKIANARQPSISPDGQRMLVNIEGGAEDNVAEYNFTNSSLKRVSDNPLDSHPFYDFAGNRVVYDNPALIIDSDGNPRGHIAVQCDLNPPHLQPDPRCRDIAALGVLVASAQVGPIEGSHPVWASNDMIIYKGCNSWLLSSSCGIYTVGSWATKGLSDGATPAQLTYNTGDIPTDTYGNSVVFMSDRDGNWEAYIMGLDGSNVRNLSNSSATNDGLPTISPDGNWVAFASDRGGAWAVWVVPIVGGTPQKLFDFPSPVPWGSHERSWTNERLSWGP